MGRLRRSYKKKKYELLSFFLGDFIPQSSFVVGNKVDGGKVKTKQYTVQERVPQVKISELSAEQKNNPVLLNNLRLLIRKLKVMHKAIDALNVFMDEKGQLDGKLDLGGLSEIAKKSNEVTELGVQLRVEDYSFIDSPNILVDPKTMKLYCIDFDQGVWSDEKEDSLRFIRRLVIQKPETVALLEESQKSAIQ